MKKNLLATSAILFPLVSASAADNPEENKEWEDKAAKLVQTVASSANSDGSPTDALKSLLVQEAVSKVDEYITGIAPRIEFSLEGVEDGKPRFSVLTVQPFYESEDLTHTGFVQGSVFRTEERTTANLGLGYRHMSEDKHWLYGINAFYDHEFPYDHRRMSVGLEARSSVFEVNANGYLGLSGWREGLDGLDERALDGYDFEIGAQLPYTPYAKVYAKRFSWNAIDGATDLEGYQYSLNVKAPIMQGLGIEAGIRDYDNQESVQFVKLTYKIDLGGKNNRKKTPDFFTTTAYEMTTMEDRRLDKVRRENKIIKQFGFQATVSGV